LRGWHNEPQRHSLAARGFRTVGNKFVYEPNRRRSIPLLYYGELKPDGKYHLVKHRVWHRDVRKSPVVIPSVTTYDSDIGYVGFFAPHENKWKLFEKRLYTKKNPRHGFGYIIEPEKNRVRAIQIIDIDDDVFDKYGENGFMDRYVREMRVNNPDHKVITREIDIPISKLARENPSSYFAGMRYAFDEEGNMVEHITDFMNVHTGPKMIYVDTRSYKNRQDAFNDWKTRNKKIDVGIETESEYTRWLRSHWRKLEA